MSPATTSIALVWTRTEAAMTVNPARKELDIDTAIAWAIPNMVDDAQAANGDHADKRTVAKTSNAGSLEHDAHVDVDHNIATRTGLHCAPLVHTQLGLVESHGGVRFSVGAFNTEADVEAAIHGVAEIARWAQERTAKRVYTMPPILARQSRASVYRWRQHCSSWRTRASQSIRYLGLPHKRCGPLLARAKCVNSGIHDRRDALR